MAKQDSIMKEVMDLIKQSMVPKELLVMNVTESIKKKELEWANREFSKGIKLLRNG